MVEELPLCRICFMNEQDEDNSQKLIAPCRCKGSIGWVHPECLRRWIQTTNYWRSHECYMCGSEYTLPKNYYSYLRDALELSFAYNLLLNFNDWTEMYRVWLGYLRSAFTFLFNFEYTDKFDGVLSRGIVCAVMFCVFTMSYAQRKQLAYIKHFLRRLGFQGIMFSVLFAIILLHYKQSIEDSILFREGPTVVDRLWLICKYLVYGLSNFLITVLAFCRIFNIQALTPDFMTPDSIL